MRSGDAALRLSIVFSVAGFFALAAGLYEIDRREKSSSGTVAANLAEMEQRIQILGTGQALDVGRRGDADVVFVHDKAAEQRFLADGFGVRRFDVMYNDFVLIGPAGDPAKIAGQKDILEALRQIAAKRAPFISRGD